MFCVKCQKRVSESSSVCPNCGGTEFSTKQRDAKFGVPCIVWILISFAANLALGAYFMFMGYIGNNPNIRFMFKPPFFVFLVDRLGEFNLTLFIMGFIIAICSFVYLIFLFARKQYLYGVLMLSAITIASFMFFFYGGSLLSIIMIPVLLMFPFITRKLIGGEWDYMG